MDNTLEPLFYPCSSSGAWKYSWSHLLYQTFNVCIIGFYGVLEKLLTPYVPFHPLKLLCAGHLCFMHYHDLLMQINVFLLVSCTCRDWLNWHHFFSLIKLWVKADAPQIIHNSISHLSCLVNMICFACQKVLIFITVVSDLEVNQLLLML